MIFICFTFCKYVIFLWGKSGIRLSIGGNANEQVPRKEKFARKRKHDEAHFEHVRAPKARNATAEMADVYKAEAGKLKK